MGNLVYFDPLKEPKIVGVDLELMACLDRARHRAGIPFIVTSGKRSAEHNLEVGGVPDSSHVTGNAVDLRCEDSKTCFKIVEALLHEGLQRIVIGLRFDKSSPHGIAFHNVHVDNDFSKPYPIISYKFYA